MRTHPESDGDRGTSGGSHAAGTVASGPIQPFPEAPVLTARRRTAAVGELRTDGRGQRGQPLTGRLRPGRTAQQHPTLTEAMRIHRLCSSDSSPRPDGGNPIPKSRGEEGAFTSRSLSASAFGCSSRRAVAPPGSRMVQGSSHFPPGAGGLVGDGEMLPPWPA